MTGTSGQAVEHFSVIEDFHLGLVPCSIFMLLDSESVVIAATRYFVARYNHL